MTVDELRSALEKANKVKSHLNENDLLKIRPILRFAEATLILTDVSKITTLVDTDMTREFESCSKIIDDFYNKLVCN